MEIVREEFNRFHVIGFQIPLGSTHHQNLEAVSWIGSDISW